MPNTCENWREAVEIIVEHQENSVFTTDTAGTFPKNRPQPSRSAGVQSRYARYPAPQFAASRPLSAQSRKCSDFPSCAAGLRILRWARCRAESTSGAPPVRRSFCGSQQLRRAFRSGKGSPVMRTRATTPASECLCSPCRRVRPPAGRRDCTPPDRPPVLPCSKR